MTEEEKKEMLEIQKKGMLTFIILGIVAIISFIVSFIFG